MSDGSLRTYSAGSEFIIYRDKFNDYDAISVDDGKETSFFSFDINSHFIGVEI
jgi:hypothetical protein